MQALDTSRLRGASIQQLTTWLAKTDSLLRRHDYKPSNIFNMDKTGMAIGSMQSTWVVAIVDKGTVTKLPCVSDRDLFNA